MAAILLENGNTRTQYEKCATNRPLTYQILTGKVDEFEGGGRANEHCLFGVHHKRCYSNNTTSIREVTRVTIALISQEEYLQK